jgi:hypothetical protein
MLVACSDESVARTFQKRSVSSAAAEQTVSPSGESDMWSTCSPESNRFRSHRAWHAVTESIQPTAPVWVPSSVGALQPQH